MLFPRSGLHRAPLHRCSGANWAILARGSENNAIRRGLLDVDLSEDLALLRDRRVNADYWEDNVDLEEASEALDLAGRFLGLLDEEGGG